MIRMFFTSARSFTRPWSLESSETPRFDKAPTPSAQRLRSASRLSSSSLRLGFWGSRSRSNLETQDSVSSRMEAAVCSML